MTPITRPNPAWGGACGWYLPLSLRVISPARPRCCCLLGWWGLLNDPAADGPRSGQGGSSQDWVHVLLFCTCPAASVACIVLSAFGTYLPHRDRQRRWQSPPIRSLELPKMVVFAGLLSLSLPLWGTMSFPAMAWYSCHASARFALSAPEFLRSTRGPISFPN